MQSLSSMRGGVYELDLGEIVICEQDGLIVRVQWRDQCLEAEHFENLKPSALSARCASELELYLSGKLKCWSVPLAPSGSEFEMSVWRELMHIPYAQVQSYAQIAQKIGNPKACRAVGSACGKNPILILIPCHRVVRTDGTMGGYAGGIERKAKLLELESRHL